jgi:hypothetical protein
VPGLTRAASRGACGLRQYGSVAGQGLDLLIPAPEKDGRGGPGCSAAIGRGPSSLQPPVHPELQRLRARVSEANPKFDAPPPNGIPPAALCARQDAPLHRSQRPRTPCLHHLHVMRCGGALYHCVAMVASSPCCGTPRISQGASCGGTENDSQEKRPLAWERLQVMVRPCFFLRFT